MGGSAPVWPSVNKGGERRLNVAVTRARSQVVVYCSFDPKRCASRRTAPRASSCSGTYLMDAQDGNARSGDLIGRAPTAGPPPLRDRRLASGAWAEGPRERRPIRLSDRSAMGWRRVDRVWFPMWLNPRDEVLAGIGRTVELALNPHYVDVLPEAKPPRPADPAAAEGPSAGWDHRWLQARGALGRYSGARGSLCRGRAHARESGASSGSATPSARATAFGRTGSTRPTPRDFPGFMPEFDVRQEVGETSCMALLHNAEVSAIQVDNGASVRLWLMDEALSVQAGRNLKRRELVNSQFQDVVLIDAETLEVGGLVFRIESPSDADEFMAAFHSRQTQKAESAAARSAALRELTEPFSTDDDRWQYLVVNTGAFNTASRLTDVLSATGRAGWELVTIYDKSSNWLAGIENGFMLLRRRVPPGIEPANWATQQ